MPQAFTSRLQNHDVTNSSMNLLPRSPVAGVCKLDGIAPHPGKGVHNDIAGASLGMVLGNALRGGRVPAPMNTASQCQARSMTCLGMEDCAHSGNGAPRQAIRVCPAKLCNRSGQVPLLCNTVLLAASAWAASDTRPYGLSAQPKIQCNNCVSWHSCCSTQAHCKQAGMRCTRCSQTSSSHQPSSSSLMPSSKRENRL